MKILDGIKYKGQPFEISNSSRDDLPQFFVDRGYKVGAEIGVYKGEYSQKLCEVGLHVNLVDPWLVYSDYRKHPKELPYDELERLTRERLKHYNCTIIKKTSMEALEDIPDESQDFVYIDGNHSLPYVVQDIFGWYKKVRVGGVISGHDYFVDKHNPYWIRACHVKHAVDICVKIFEVENFYVTSNDKYNSWFFIKK